MDPRSFGTISSFTSPRWNSARDPPPGFPRFRFYIMHALCKLAAALKPASLPPQPTLALIEQTGPFIRGSSKSGRQAAAPLIHLTPSRSLAIDKTNIRTRFHLDRHQWFTPAATRYTLRRTKAPLCAGSTFVRSVHGGSTPVLIPLVSDHRPPFASPG